MTPLEKLPELVRGGGIFAGSVLIYQQSSNARLGILQAGVISLVYFSVGLYAHRVVPSSLTDRELMRARIAVYIAVALACLTDAILLNANVVCPDCRLSEILMLMLERRPIPVLLDVMQTMTWLVIGECLLALLPRDGSSNQPAKDDREGSEQDR